MYLQRLDFGSPEFQMRRYWVKGLKEGSLTLSPWEEIRESVEAKVTVSHWTLLLALPTIAAFHDFLSSSPTASFPPSLMCCCCLWFFFSCLENIYFLVGLVKSFFKAQLFSPSRAIHAFLSKSTSILYPFTVLHPHSLQILLPPACGRKQARVLFILNPCP